MTGIMMSQLLVRVKAVVYACRTMIEISATILASAWPASCLSQGSAASVHYRIGAELRRGTPRQEIRPSIHGTQARISRCTISSVCGVWV
ncbi:hypothetical protein F5Y10DRAFT_235822, partial [Nemania abortiva]